MVDPALIELLDGYGILGPAPRHRSDDGSPPSFGSLRRRAGRGKTATSQAGAVSPPATHRQSKNDRPPHSRVLAASSCITARVVGLGRRTIYASSTTGTCAAH